MKAESASAGADALPASNRVPTVADLHAWATRARPVFILGVERSGTSMLYLTLGRHSAFFKIRSVFETRCFSKTADLLASPVDKMVAGYLGGAAGHAAFLHLARQLDLCATSDAQDVVRAFLWYAAHEVHAGLRPLEKTPAHIWNLPAIMRAFPRARVLVCVRRPVEVATSYRKRLTAERKMGLPRQTWAWLDKSVPELIQHCHNVELRIGKALKLWPGQIYVVPYSHITGSPAESIAEILAFLHEPQEDLLGKPSPARDRAQYLSAPGPHAKAQGDDEASEWLSPQDVALIAEQTRDLELLWNQHGARASTPTS